MSLSMPKGKSFSNRFYALIIFVILTIVVVGIWMFFSLSPQNGMVGHIAQHHNKHLSSAQAASDIKKIQQTPVAPILLKGWTVHLHGKNYQVYQKNGVSFTKENGQMHALENGDIVYQNGQAYRYENGKLVPLSNATAQKFLKTHLSAIKAGQFILKDGKLYEMGKDGKLHLFHGKLKPGDIVWKNGVPYVVGKDGKLHRIHNGQIEDINGKPYIFEHGHFIPLSQYGAQSGNLVNIGGKLYKIGKDGNLHLYHGKLTAGQTLWKNGKIYEVGKDGKLIALKNGTLALSKDGQAFIVDNGRLIPENKPCTVIYVHHSPYYIGQDGKAHPFKEHDQCTNDKGQTIVMSGGKIITLTHKEKTKPFWWVNMDSKAEKTAMSAPLQVIAGAGENQPSKPSNNNTKPLPSNNTQKEIAAALAHSQANGYGQQNGQSGKLAFMRASQKQQNGILAANTTHNMFPYSLNVGTIIPATLITGIDSDLPGKIIAQVSRNVYDTPTGNYLLIPQGTKLYGLYDSGVSYGQKRVLIAWEKLIFPNGTTFNLMGMPGVDLTGAAGLHDQVDNHYFRIFGSSLMFSLFGALSQLSQPNNTGNGGPTNQQIVYSAVGQQTTQVSSNMIAKNMNIQPTIKIRPGDNFNILITRKMVFDGPYHFGNAL